MKPYAYKAVTPQGQLETGSVEAADADAVLRILDKRGLIAVSVDEDVAAAARPSARGLRIAAPQVTQFLSDLSIMVNAGIRVDEALSIMEREFDNGRLKPIVARLRDELSGGKSFSQALEEWPGLFPPFQVAMIRIAERSGRLPTLLARIAEERQRFERLAAKVGEALRYPAVLFAGTIAVMTFFLVGVVPQFEPILAQTGQVDRLLEVMFAVSRGMRVNSDIILGGLAILLLCGLLAMRRAGFRARLRKLGARLPFLSEIAVAYRAARFTRLLGIMFETGVGAPATIRLIGDAIDPADPDRRAERAADLVRQGRRLSEALEVMALPGLAVRMLKLGEESGDLTGMAFRAADFYEVRLERLLSRLVGFIGPAAVITISVLIGGMIVSIMSALMSFNDLVR